MPPNHPEKQPVSFSAEVEKLIAQFRGLPEYGLIPRGRPVCGLADLIGKLEETYRIGQPGIEETLMADWRNIVGENLAHRCRPGKIVKQSKLVILAVNPVIRQELNFQRSALLRKIRKLPGCDGIREVSIQNA